MFFSALTDKHCWFLWRVQGERSTRHRPDGVRRLRSPQVPGSSPRRCLFQQQMGLRARCGCGLSRTVRFCLFPIQKEARPSHSVDRGPCSPRLAPATARFSHLAYRLTSSAFTRFLRYKPGSVVSEGYSVSSIRPCRSGRRVMRASFWAHVSAACAACAERSGLSSGRGRHACFFLVYRPTSGAVRWLGSSGYPGCKVQAGSAHAWLLAFCAPPRSRGHCNSLERVDAMARPG